MDTTKYISVPKATRREIQAIFKCSRVTVWSALNYRTTGDQPDKIRKMAIAKGGVIYDPGLGRESTKTHNTHD